MSTAALLRSLQRRGALMMSATAGCTIAGTWATAVIGADLSSGPPALEHALHFKSHRQWPESPLIKSTGTYTTRSQMADGAARWACAEKQLKRHIRQPAPWGDDAAYGRSHEKEWTDSRGKIGTMHDIEGHPAWRAHVQKAFTNSHRDPVINENQKLAWDLKRKQEIRATDVRAAAAYRRVAVTWAAELHQKMQQADLSGCERRDLLALQAWYPHLGEDPEERAVAQRHNWPGHLAELTWPTWGELPLSVSFPVALHRAQHRLQRNNGELGVVAAAVVWGSAWAYWPAYNAWRDHFTNPRQTTAEQVGRRVLLRSWCLATVTGGTICSAGLFFFVGVPFAMAVSSPVLAVGWVATPFVVPRIAAALRARAVAQGLGFPPAGTSTGPGGVGTGTRNGVCKAQPPWMRP